MRVLMISRATLYSSPGGDTIQVQSTAKYLEKLGIKVDIRLTNDRAIDYASYSVLHFFNVIRPADLLFHAEKAGKPYVLSTIYVDYSEYEKKSRRGMLQIFSSLFDKYRVEYIKTIARAVVNNEKLMSRKYIWLGHKASMKKLMTEADYLLPNSESEMRRLESDLGVKLPYEVVPNAIDKEKFQTPEINSAREGVICVARIEGLKNQLNLIKAMSGTSLKLSIIGKSSPNHKKYLDLCKEAAGGNVEFVDHLSQEELRAIYAKAKVHILPSWFETTGLSSLEAGYMGCNLVVTPKGDTREYFEDLALYCEPDDISSIRAAVEKAYSTPVSDKLRRRIEDRYVWEVTAKKTLEVYRQVLSKKKR